MNALEKLDARWKAGGRICVGLDSRYEMLPEMFRGNGPYSGMRSFNSAIVRHTMDLALAYKLNLAPYMRQGASGLNALIDTFTLIHREAPEVFTILDCKSGDALDDINADYAHFAFEQCGADAMTAQVYAGGDAAEGFTRYADKLIFFLCKTSNPGSWDLQCRTTDETDLKLVAWEPGPMLYQVVAALVAQKWNNNNNCGLVVGATAPEMMRIVREDCSIGEMPILSPGIGKQAGDFAATVRAGIIPGKGRLIINEGRSIIFAEYDKHEQKHGDPFTFAKAARHRLVERTAEYNNILELEAA